MAVNDNLRPVDEYPDISFIDNYTITKLENDMIEWFKKKRKELTGEGIVLGKVDDRRIILQTGAYFIFQGYMYSDDAGKMGLLKYSRGDFLENLGALKHIYRKEAVGATTTIRFLLKQERATTTGIPKGTRMTAGDGVYFATDRYVEILPGALFAEVTATCLTAGSKGNYYDVGDIKTMVDPVPFIDSAENITRPENGADIESDDSLRQRIYIAPASYSTAGSDDAYEYFVREYNSDIVNVRITSPEPGIVRIRYLLDGGAIPGEGSLSGLQEYLMQSDIRPLTDKVEVLAPEVVEYNLNLVYFINLSDQNRANVIQQRVEEAIAEYILWQKTEIGRDINPDALLEKIIAAGAKRVEITSPAFTVVGEDSVASLSSQTILYGGLEHD